MDVNLLKSKMILHGDTQRALAKYLGISEQRLSAKLNGKNNAEFHQSEILSIKKKYDLTSKEVDDIFFKNFVS